MFTIIETKNFKSEVLREDKPVLLARISRDYGCIEQTKVLVAIAKEYGEEIKVCLLDENSIVTFKKCGIDGSPAFVIFYEGIEISRKLGKADKEVLSLFVSKSIADIRES